MIIVIDGYNLLKQVLHSGVISDYERQQFIKRLIRYNRTKHHKIVLVFDAGPLDRPTKERFDTVYVVYSGLQMTADDYIREYVERNRGADMLLVTSDRELRRHARHESVESVPSDEFYALVIATLSPEPQPRTMPKAGLIKTTEAENFELDVLMQEMLGNVPYKKDDIVVSDKESSKKMSKKERKLFKQIKKL